MSTGTVAHKETEMSVDPQILRMTMRLWASGVTVVTAAQNGKRFGTTASSFTSVSLTPPLILACLYKTSETAKVVIDGGSFGISILGDGQAALSEQFAGHKPLPEDEDRFYNVPTSTKTTGAPILNEAIAWLDCRVHAVHDGGTHWIIVGEVLATGRHEEEVNPLIYHNRGYHSIVS